MRRSRRPFAPITAALAAVLILEVGCEERITGYPEQPRTIVSCYLERASLRVQWVEGVDQVNAECGSVKHTAYGCTKDIQDISGERFATLVVTRPKDFNDEPVLAVLGHELCHALGGVHENPK